MILFIFHQIRYPYNREKSIIAFVKMKAKHFFLKLGLCFKILN